MATNDDLHGFVRDALARGISRAEVADALSGELTGRFILQVLTAAALAGGASRSRPRARSSPAS
jgi:hypothetical protein